MNHCEGSKFVIRGFNRIKEIKKSMKFLLMGNIYIYIMRHSNISNQINFYVVVLINKKKICV